MTTETLEKRRKALLDRLKQLGQGVQEGAALAGEAFIPSLMPNTAEAERRRQLLQAAATGTLKGLAEMFTAPISAYQPFSASLREQGRATMAEQAKQGAEFARTPLGALTMAVPPGQALIAPGAAAAARAAAGQAARTTAGALGREAQTLGKAFTGPAREAGFAKIPGGGPKGAFYIYRQDLKTWEAAADAKSVKFPEHPDYEFFVHANQDTKAGSAHKFIVSESKTGAAVGYGGTPAIAKASALRDMNRVGEEQMKATVERVTALSGVSPRWEGLFQSPVTYGVGDKVFAIYPGLGGIPSRIEGIIYKSKTGLRVRITSAEAGGARTQELSTRWKKPGSETVPSVPPAEVARGQAEMPIEPIQGVKSLPNMVKAQIARRDAMAKAAAAKPITKPLPEAARPAVAAGAPISRVAREWDVRVFQKMTGDTRSVRVMALDEIEAGREAKRTLDLGSDWVVEKVTIPTVAKAVPVTARPAVQPPVGKPTEAVIAQPGPVAVSRQPAPSTLGEGPPPAQAAARPSDMAQSHVLVPDATPVVVDDFLAQASPGGIPPSIPPRRPPRPPGPPGKARPMRSQPEREKALADIENLATLGETPSETLLRRYEGAITTAQLEARQMSREGNRLLRTAGIGQEYRGGLRMRQRDLPDLDVLTEALHNPSKVASGEIVVPAKFQAAYEKARALTNWEETFRLDFDPAMAQVTDYFYRGWKPPSGITGGAGRGVLGIRPSFQRPRVDATYRGMRDLGFEPLSWNPFEQWRISRMQGERYRQQTMLVRHFKKSGVAVSHAGGPIPEGWRVPQIGPAFEGKPHAIIDAAGNPQTVFTRRWIVPNAMADSLENVFKRPADAINVTAFGQNIDLLKAIDALTFTPKRVKLFGSLFQQKDFLTRSYVGAWTGFVDQLHAGRPIEAVKKLAIWPRSAYQIIEANLSPGYRDRLRQELLSTKPIVPERPDVHLRGMMEAGLSVTDVTILPSGLDEVATQVAKESGLLGLRRVKEAIGSIESAMRRGLFEGTYPAAQVSDIKNNIAQMFIRQFPDATGPQLNGMIARFTNTKYSTIPASQSLIQNRVLRETLRRFFFSIGESEALLRQGTQAIKGPYAAMWRTHWIAAWLGLVSMAGVIHYASTGKMLPFDRWVPLGKDNWGPLPFGYSRQFAAPDVPLKGRGGVNVTLDLVDQLDTVFRILDPMGFVGSRESVPIRAAVNQLTGKDFFGAPVNDVGPGGIYSRTARLISDFFSPIGIGGIAEELARQRIPGVADVLSEGESRLGLAGIAVQGIGANLRAETTPQLRDRMAREAGFVRPDGQPVQTWDDLGPSQKRQLLSLTGLGPELQKRNETLARQGSAYHQGEVAMLRADNERRGREEALVKELEGGLNPDRFKDTFSDIMLAWATQRKQIDQDYKRFQEEQELPDDPFKYALVEYYRAYDNARLASGRLDYDALEIELARLRATWTPQQVSYVDDNTGLTEHPPVIQEYLDGRKRYKAYWEAEDMIMQARGWGDMIPQMQKYNLANVVEQRAMNRAARGRFTQVKRAASRAKLLMRRRNPEMEAFLLRYGYITAPQTYRVKRAAPQILDVSVPLSSFSFLAQPARAAA